MHFTPVEKLARRIEHTALAPEVNKAALRRLCDEACEYGFYGVCVNPAWVKYTMERLVGSDVVLVSVAGFPLGASRTDIKIAEAATAVEDGADEIDMVANIGWICADRFVEVEAEIRKIRRNLPDATVLKVIIESAKLSEKQQQNAAMAVINGGAQFVKTGTGFFGSVNVNQVRLLKETVGEQIGIKAAGGIGDAASAFALVEAGATRLGASHSVEIIRDLL